MSTYRPAICAHCGAPLDPWSGGQGSAERCSDAACLTNHPRREPEVLVLRVEVPINPAMLDDVESDVLLALVVGNVRDGIAEQLDRKRQERAA